MTELITELAEITVFLAMLFIPTIIWMRHPEIEEKPRRHRSSDPIQLFH